MHGGQSFFKELEDKGAATKDAIEKGTTKGIVADRPLSLPPSHQPKHKLNKRLRQRGIVWWRLGEHW